MLQFLCSGKHAYPDRPEFEPNEVHHRFQKRFYEPDRTKCRLAQSALGILDARAQELELSLGYLGNDICRPITPTNSTHQREKQTCDDVFHV